MMTSAQVVETSVNVTSNSPSQDYTYPDDHNLPNYDMTPGFKPFTVLKYYNLFSLRISHIQVQFQLNAGPEINPGTSNINAGGSIFLNLTVVTRVYLDPTFNWEDTVLRFPREEKTKIPFDYLQQSYPSEYKRDIRIEFIIISIEDTSGSSWLYLINVLTNPSSPLHPFALSF